MGVLVGKCQVNGEPARVGERKNISNGEGGGGGGGGSRGEREST